MFLSTEQNIEQLRQCNSWKIIVWPEEWEENREPQVVFFTGSHEQAQRQCDVEFPNNETSLVAN